MQELLRSRRGTIHAEKIASYAAGSVTSEWSEIADYAVGGVTPRWSKAAVVAMRP